MNTPASHERRRAAPRREGPLGGQRTTRSGERGGTRFVDGYLGYLLGQANHALFKDFEPAVRAAGLSGIEWRVLAVLHDSEPLAVSQLALDVLSKQPTVTKLVQRMAEQGWVALQACPTDQRRTLVAASPASGLQCGPFWCLKPFRGTATSNTNPPSALWAPFYGKCNP